MPTIEAPSTPPSGTPDGTSAGPPRQPDAPLLRGRARYEGLEHHELLSLIDQLDDERSRARMREGLWIALIFHLLVFWFLAYGPQVLFHQPRVKDPVEAIKERKDLNYLDMPPDALRPKKPKPSNIISNQTHVAQTNKPTLDKKTLEQLQAMQRAGHPEPPPAAQQQATNTPPPPEPPRQQQPAPQQQQQQLPAAPQPTQQALLDAPRPAAHPNTTFPTNDGGAVGQMIRDAARNAANGHGQYGNYGDNATPQHEGIATGMEVLSDTMGVDFGPYLQRLRHDIQENWEPLIPESARPPLLKQGVTGIRFIILPNGKIGDIKLESPSGDVSLDRAAWGGILGASPFPPLPKEFHGPMLELRCGFFYNEKPG